MRSFDQRIKRSFLFITFGLAWSMAALLLARPDLPSPYFLFFACLAPVAAAYIVHESTTNRSLVQSVFLKAKPNSWWLLSVIIPILFAVTFIFSYPIEWFTFHSWWFLLVGISFFLEVGWRGFFQKELELKSFWLSSLTTGILMACWTTPLLLVFFGLDDAHLLPFILYFLFIAAPSTLFISLTKSLIPPIILNGLLLYLLTVLLPSFPMLVVYFSLLLFLNGLTMLANSVFPEYFYRSFVKHEH
ncbi:hypothetical protein ACE1TH_19300 [Shouchella sp. JSM 1781072]|uniref:hypothetical protein n=1 Tax=Bacillaceae TaxID=186817 RepID=UPI000C0753BD|nr:MULTISPECIES: hypothetical protein [Bacillaceae]UTR07473.1 hypothetical protein MM326_05440 [Alkalihalobacillus sp. LMS6]